MILDVESVVTPVFEAYVVPEASLHRLWRAQGVRRIVKIASTIVSLYAYVRADLPHALKLCPSIFAEHHVEDRQALGMGAAPTDPAGYFMAAAGVNILSTAYSNETRMKEQLLRRIKAACAGIGAPAPELATVTIILTETGWNARELPPPLDDLLGCMVTHQAAGGHNVESRIATLAQIPTLLERRVISAPAGALLTQACLVYMRYHSTSITFIPAALAAARKVRAHLLPQIEADIENFRNIAETVLDAPYMGMRSTIPEVYQIASFPQLVYLGILYYQRGLTTEKEKAMFADYKTTEIKQHISPVEDQVLIEQLCATLPDITIQSIAMIVSAIGHARAEAYMCSRPPEVVESVYQILKASDNPGAWAADRMRRETAAADIKMMASGAALIRGKLDLEYASRQERATIIADPAERMAALIRLQNWKAEISESIEALRPVEDQLSAALDQVEEHARMGVAGRIRTIMTQIAAGRD